MGRWSWCRPARSRPSRGRCCPSLRGRPVTVARSAGEWLRGREWSAPATAAGPAPAPHPVPRRAVFATGPRVDRAEEEVRSSAAHWPDAEVLPLARPQELLAAADGAALVHVAAHGVHDADNPLFSSLELTDGLVFGHDLTRVHAAPAARRALRLRPGPVHGPARR